MSKDPLLQPYTLKHLTLKNRIMTTAHEPAYPEDGLPKDRYRAYHVERAKGGVAMTTSRIGRCGSRMRCSSCSSASSPSVSSASRS